MLLFVRYEKTARRYLRRRAVFYDNEIIDQGLLFMGMNSWVSPTYLVAGRMIRPS